MNDEHPIAIKHQQQLAASPLGKFTSELPQDLRMSFIRLQNICNEVVDGYRQLSSGRGSSIVQSYQHRSPQQGKKDIENALNSGSPISFKTRFGGTTATNLSNFEENGEKGITLKFAIFFDKEQEIKTIINITVKENGTADFTISQPGNGVAEKNDLAIKNIPYDLGSDSNTSKFTESLIVQLSSQEREKLKQILKGNDVEISNPTHSISTATGFGNR